MTLTTLVTGSNGKAREAAIASAIVPGMVTTLILEGVPASDPPAALATVGNIIRIAPGCPCCLGNLTMRVTLNRALRHPPQRLFISLESTAHLAQFRAFLMQAPYDKLLTLTQDLPT